MVMTVVSTFWMLRIMRLWIFTYKFLQEHMLLILLGPTIGGYLNDRIKFYIAIKKNGIELYLLMSTEELNENTRHITVCIE